MSAYQDLEGKIPAVNDGDKICRLAPADINQFLAADFDSAGNPLPGTTYADRLCHAPVHPTSEDVEATLRALDQAYAEHIPGYLKPDHVITSPPAD